jgi:hypothetical protein
VDTFEGCLAVQVFMEQPTMKPIEVLLNEALDTIKAKEAENVSLKATIHQLRITAAKRERDEALKAANLPKPCVFRLNEAFAKSTDNAGLKEAINCEKRGCL